jgi:hypothetical protein
MGAIRNALKFLFAKPEGRDHSEDLGVDGRIISTRIFGKEDWRVLIGLIWLRIGSGGGLL